jgi:nitrate/TMAO reductase-like tetraheme cytochrome c subunit
MFTKRFIIWCMLGLFAVAALGSVLLVLPVQAAVAQPLSNTTTVEPACNSCHDNLYYNYDLGKSYCVSKARTRCVDCHGGDPLALDKATAHTNLVAWPVWAGDYSNCQSCHPQDAEARVKKFAAIAGFSSAATAQQVAYTFTPPPVSSAFPTLSEDEELSWQAKTLISLAAVLLLIGALVYSRSLRH